MSRIFISYARVDRVAAAAVCDWLAKNGWKDDVFFDVDPEQGIAGGANWRDALKKAACRCEAVVVILSRDWIESRVCWSEFQLAEKQRKPIIPIIIDDRLLPADLLPPELAVYQAIDQVTATSEDFELRLQRALQDAGAGPENFPLPEGAVPYKGLPALTENDAALFFGRDAEVLAALDTLREIRETGRKRTMVILGASGAGKSSLLRAGIWARTNRNDRAFLAVPVVRPGDAALTGATGLWQALAAACNDRRWKSNLPAETPRTRAAIAAAVAKDSKALDRLLQDLKRAASAGFLVRPSNAPSPILFIDQGDELLGAERSEESDSLLRYVRQLHVADEDFITVIAVRSDIYPKLQEDSRFDPESLRPFNLSPMSEASFASVVVGPAKRVGLEVAPALQRDLLVGAKGADALPLLAFTLERLYLERLRPDRLTPDDFTRLGGHGGAISLGAAEVQRKAHQRGIDKSTFDVLLRKVFLPHLARVNDAGAFARRIAQRSDFKPDCLPVVDLLVEGRLLVADQRDGHAVVEIAHEAILREWPQLAGWLESERHFLEWREQLGTARRLAELGQGDLLSGRALVVSQGFFETRAADLRQAERDFIQRSLAAEEERLAAIEEQKDRQRRAEVDAAKAREDAARAEAAAEKQVAAQAFKATRRTRQFAGLMALLVAGIAFALYDRQLKQTLAVSRAVEAETAKTQSESRRLAGVAQDLRTRFGDSKALAIAWLALTKEGALREGATTDEAASAIYTSAIVPVARMDDHLAFVLSPDGRYAYSHLAGQESRLWRTDTLETIQTFHSGVAPADPESNEDPVEWSGPPARFSADGDRIGVLSAGELRYHTYGIGHHQRGAAVTIPDPKQFGMPRYLDVVIAPDLKHLLLVTDDHIARLFDVEKGTVVAKLPHVREEGDDDFYGDYVDGAVSPSGRHVVLRWSAWKATDNEVWDVRTSRVVLSLSTHEYDAPLVFDSSEQFLVSGPLTRMVWNINRSADEYRFISSVGLGSDELRDFAFLPAGISPPAALRDYIDLLPTTREVCRDRGEADQGDRNDCAQLSSVTYPAMWAVAPDKIWQRFRIPAAPYKAAHNGRAVGISRLRNSCHLTYVDLVAQRVLSSIPIEFDGACSFDERDRLSITPDGRLAFVLMPTVVSDSAAESARRTLSIYRLSPELPDFVATAKADVAEMAEETILLASTDDAAQVDVLDRTSERIATASFESSHLVSALAQSSDSARFATGDWGGTVRLATMEGADLAVLASHEAPVSALSFSRDLIATGGYDGSLRLVEVESKRAVATLRGHTSGISTVLFSANGERFASASFDGSVRLWSREGKELGELRHDGAVLAARFSPTGEWLATAVEDGTVRLWDLASRNSSIAVKGHESLVRDVIWSSKGDRLLSWSDDRTARIWSSTGTALHTLNGHAAELTHGVFAQDISLAATGDRSGQVRIWDVATGALLATRQAGNAPLAALGFMSQPRVLVALSKAGGSYAWPVMPGGLSERVTEVGAMVKTSRPLTNEECRQFYVNQLPAAHDVCGELVETPQAE